MHASRMPVYRAFGNMPDFLHDLAPDSACAIASLGVLRERPTERPALTLEQRPHPIASQLLNYE